jgi:hypothetical protein
LLAALRRALKRKLKPRSTAALRRELGLDDSR